MLQRRLVLDHLNGLLGVLEAPLGEQQARQDGVDPDLGALRVCQAPHEMQLRGLGHGVCHRRSGERGPGDGGGDDEHAALRVAVECREGFAEEPHLSRHVCSPALLMIVLASARSSFVHIEGGGQGEYLIPIILSKRFQVSEVTKFSISLVVLAQHQIPFMYN